MTGDEATLILSESLDFPETRRIVRMNVWSVPESGAYPDGIKYRLYYGTVEGETILRYDNSHADTKGHERHTAGGVDPAYEYPDNYKAVLERFQRGLKTMNTTTNHDNEPMHRTLTVRVANPTDAFEKVAERFDALDPDDDVEPLYEITFQGQRGGSIL